MASFHPTKGEYGEQGENVSCEGTERVRRKDWLFCGPSLPFPVASATGTF